ncbi:MAG TPA: type I DNA topoisomerase [Agitococcus sp.]|nr:type I DNA topoisomerase [Agitococcus sp.]
MGFKLLVVESPKKAKTIAGILGGAWRVGASFGHIRDLPDKDYGVDRHTFKPSYVIPDKAKDNLGKLKTLAAQADDIYLATDLDREGEAIAYHLAHVLKIKNAKRIGFTEITAQAINKALMSPRPIDINLVMAQEARRVADRVVGYDVSSTLCKQANRGLSAGRVQTPALRLVVDIEKKIRDFVPKGFYEVYVTLDNELELKHNPKNCSPDEKHLFDKELAEKIAQTKRVCITNVDVRKRETKPKSPLTTSLLQQVANSSLKLNASKTMEIAQSLFESGHITYHRTDNPNMSAEGFDAASQWLTSKGFTPNNTPHKWPAKDNAQGAHEAIRPTNFNNIVVDSNSQVQQLYALIHERAVASCMPSAIDEVTTIEACSENHYTFNEEQIKALFKAVASVELVKGWRQLMVLDSPDDKESLGKIQKVPRVGDIHGVIASKIDSKMTAPPPRYTEGSLIKKLEALGIGRPSTYATIVQNIISKSYIQVGSPDNKDKNKQSLFPTELGIAIIDALKQQKFLDYDFTANLEDELDEIANSATTYNQVISQLYDVIQQDITAIKLDRGLLPLGEFEQACPKCSKAIKRLQKKDKSGHFWVHIEEADAEGCERFIADNRGKPVKLESLGQPCPKCEKAIKRVQKRDKSGFFWVHVDEVDANNCERFIPDNRGKPTKLESVNQPCPKCTKLIKRLQKKDKSGYFWVHIEEADAEGCGRFIADNQGKPI